MLFGQGMANRNVRREVADVCLGIPAKVISVDGLTALVDFGGVRKEVLVAASEISPGDLVVIHAGMVIGKLSEEDFLENVALYRDIRARELVEEGLDEGAAAQKATDEMKEMLSSLGFSIADTKSTANPSNNPRCTSGERKSE